MAAVNVFTGSCPDPQCQKRLTFLKKYDNIECPNCGQLHPQEKLNNVKPLAMDLSEPIQMLIGQTVPKLPAKKGPDSVKVNGLSNYHCKILSRFLTRFGMDKSGTPKLLTELGRAETFDCSILGSRAFLLEPKYLNVIGFGKDGSGSLDYLRDTLNQIYQFNGGRECLVPIHADGDGHCLVHAISRAIVGRELFWHPLREDLRQHFLSNQSKYKDLFQDFIDADEWEWIIRECEPDYVPQNGEPLGMRNIHIFGLANVLHRPIILLDSMVGMQSPGDYTGVFLPCLVNADQCRGQDKTLNKPLCIAWSSQGRNHYIPLVALKEEDQCLPRLPRCLLPQVWGVGPEMMNRYIEFDDNDSCVIGGDKSLKDSYIQRLASCMDRVFAESYCVTAGDVADVYHYIHKSNTALDNSTPDEIIDYTRRTLQDHRLYRCLTCEAVSEFFIDNEQVVRGGELYAVAERNHGPLMPERFYVFGPPSGVTCEYDDKSDSLVVDWSKSQMSYCPYCDSSVVRRLLQDGAVVYQNGDKTRTPAENTNCPCGFKHWWDGNEYDNLPKVLPVVLEWGGDKIVDEVCWWDSESDESLNSNVYTTAQRMVQKHFPGEFGSERLVQRVVDSIMARTRAAPPSGEPACADRGDADTNWQDDQSSKIILTGPKSTTFHREELTMSKTERNILARTEQNARLQQKKKSLDLPTKTTEKSKPSAPSPSPTTKTSPRKISPPSEDVHPRPGGSGGKEEPEETKKKQSVNTNERKVKVQTSDGRNGQLTLLPETTFDQLQTMVESQFTIPPNLQRIRYGFPPKELNGQCCPLPVQHGDKIVVEILKPKPKAKKPILVPSRDWTNDSDAQGTITDSIMISLDRKTTGKRQLTESSLEKLILNINDRIRGLGIDAVREACDCLDVNLRSFRQHLDLWGIVQRHSRLFEVGGLFYRQATGDTPMVDGTALEYSLFPGKVFRYNESDDRCEVLVQPFGYFAVQQGVDDQVTIDHWRADPAHISGWGQASQLFQGQGHSLHGDDQSVHDDDDDDNTTTTTTTSPSWRRNNDQSSHQSWSSWSVWAGKGQGRTLSESSNDQRGGKTRDISYLTRDKGTMDGQGRFRRMGPGFSIMEVADEENAVNENAEQIKRVLANVLKTFSDQDQEDEEMAEVAPPPKGKLNEPTSRDLARTDSAGEDDDMDSDGYS